MTKHPLIEELDNLIASVWEEIFSSEEAKKYSSTLMNTDKRLYAMYMTQVYHYAWHTSRNLGLAGSNLFTTDLDLMKHFFEHAVGEVGHEQMACNDLKELGIPVESEKDIPPALPATEALIAYVKFLSLSEKPYRCLGYHYWIEQPYNYILSFMQALEHTMKLKKEQMSFYFNHVKIDQHHGKDIQDIVIKICTTDTYKEEIKEVIKTSLWLMFRLLQDVIAEYEKLIENKSERFAILNQIKE
jgi:hypothetical protein